MKKLCLIRTFSPQVLVFLGIYVAVAIWVAAPTSLLAQEPPTPTADQQETSTNPKPAESPQQDGAETTTAEPQYPLAVAVANSTGGDATQTLYVVDLDLPGVWRVDSSGRHVFVRGSNLLRQPLNRPRCVAIHPAGGILVGDSATREVYHISEAGGEPKPLTAGKIGIPMCLVVSPDGKTLYVGDAEKRATLSLPVDGGKPELVVRVNARGLAFDDQGKLWAATPDPVAVQRINVAEKTSEPVVTGRPYGYVNGLAWAGDSEGFVSDGYGRAIWKFNADGETERWYDGKPLVGPVAIAVTDEAVLVADPKTVQVYAIDRETKEVTARL